MLRSRSNTLLSVRRVTERNAGRLTAGVDGEVVLTPKAKAELVGRVTHSREPFKALPVRRVYIPKPGGRSSGRSGSRRSSSYCWVVQRALGSLVVTHPFHPLFGQRLEVLYVRREAAGRMYVCDGGGGRNVKLDEAATDRGPVPAERPLTFEVLVEVAAVIAALGGGMGGLVSLLANHVQADDFWNSAS